MTMTRWRAHPVQVANEQVSILYVCRQVGMEVPERVTEGRSAKVLCPFGAVSHSDGGVEAAFRVYPSSNSAWCFAGCGWFGPVKLLAMARDITLEDAAEELLRAIGWRAADPFEAMTAALEHREELDQSSLAEALKTYCSRISPEWEVEQFDPEVARTLGKCLELLPRVTTDNDARQWLETTKGVMRRALHVDDPVGVLMKGS